jgi:hypothetical protein
VKIAAIKYNVYLIKDIKNPSEEMQLIAVRKYGDTIKYMKNPSEKVQLEAIKEYSFSIMFIGNPSENAQIETVNSISLKGYIKDSDNNNFINTYIKSPKALELYNKLKNTRKIIK